MDIKQIVNKAKLLRENNSIEILKGEKEILDKLYEIEDGTNIENKDYNEKMLNYIESYLEIKRKSKIKKEDYEFLQKLANSLRKQEVRKTDTSNPPLFKIKNKDGKDLFFITREALNEYIEINGLRKGNNVKTIEILNEKSFELEKLLEVIKRSF